MIFAFWNGANPDELRATGLGGFAKRFEYVPLGNTIAVAICTEHQHSRMQLDALHPNLMTFPGPNGTLKAKHVAHIAADFPNVKEGDAFRNLLGVVYQRVPNALFDPDAY